MLGIEEKKQDQMVSLDDFAKLAGFPVKLVKEELFKDSEIEADEKLPLKDLRTAMVKYLNAAMLD